MNNAVTQEINNVEAAIYCARRSLASNFSMPEKLGLTNDYKDTSPRLRRG